MKKSKYNLIEKEMRCWLKLCCCFACGFHKDLSDEDRAVEPRIVEQPEVTTDQVRRSTLMSDETGLLSDCSGYQTFGSCNYSCFSPNESTTDAEPARTSHLSSLNLSKPGEFERALASTLHQRNGQLFNEINEKVSICNS